MKTPFVTKDQLEAIAAQYPTPFHIYDEQGIRENARRLRKAFAWNPGYREYFAVKAAPTPALLKLLHEEGCGCDCSSMTELMISERCGITGENIMFSSNDTPAEEFQMADRLGAIINLDDLTLVDYLERSIGHVPEKICCRYNPGGVFTLGETREGFQVMDNPGDAKYGMTRAQIAEAFTRLSAMGAKEFGIHAFLASNTLSNEYYPALARVLFQLAAELKEETGAVPDTFLPMGVTLPSPGCLSERLYLFLAKGLHMESQQLDEDEFLNVERIPFNEMVHRVMDGEIEDSKTIAAVLKAKVLLNL